MASTFTAAPQLTSVLQLARDLLRSLAELGALPSTRNLQADLTSLVAYCEDRGVDVDVVVASPIGSTAARAVAAWLSPAMDPSVLVNAGAGAPGEVTFTLGDGRSILRIFGATHSPVQKVAAPRPAVLMALAGSFEALAPGQREALEDDMDDRAMMVLLNDAGESSASMQGLALQRQVAVVETASVEGLAAGAWRARVEAGPLPAMPVILRAYAALYAIETAASALRLVIEQEQRSIKVKRALAQQENAKLQLPVASPMELIGETRSQLQRTFSEFERTVQEGLRALFLPRVGSLSQTVEQYLLSLAKFEEQKGEKTITLRLGEPVESEFFRIIREACQAKCVEDLVRVNELFEGAAARGNATLAAMEAPSFEVQHAVISELRISRMLDSALRVDRPYRGELPNPGIQEYSQQVKKYLNIGVAILSTAGVSMTVLPKKAVLIITMALTGAGVATLPQRIKRERAENLTKEFERARDVMRSEARRIFADVEREWMALVGEALRDEQTFYLQQFESSVREGQSRRANELADDKRRLQRQLSGMDNTDKLLAATKRTRDAVETGATQLRTALRVQLAGAGGPGARRPA